MDCCRGGSGLSEKTPSNSLISIVAKIQAPPFLAGLTLEFVRYYERGETDLDELYFLREFGDWSNLELARVYDLDEKTSASHDWIVSRIIAFNKYRGDIRTALYRLQHPMKAV